MNNNYTLPSTPFRPHISLQFFYNLFMLYISLSPLALSPLTKLLPFITNMEEKHKGEVMWPRMIANKLLQRPLGTNFVADFPSSDITLQKAASDHPLIKKYDAELMENHNYKLFASTWNVGGNPPSDALDLGDWLDTENNSYDIYVLGFQEVVPLSAKNVLGREKSKISTKWNALIRELLNKSICKELKGGEKQKVYPIKDGNQGFRCIISKQMVGVSISVWVRSHLLRFISHPSVSCVGCGIMGCLGNKGSISVRFFLHETSFCFVCCHLASGEKERDELNRNSNAMDIFSRTSFNFRGPSNNLPQKILEHDRIILLGDLNYRISLPESETRSLVEQKEWDILLQKDQLQREVREGGALEGWNEGAIEFTPTYKYYPNSDDYYYGCLQHNKGEKKAPAWCDRILWRGKGWKQLCYNRYESKLSDHRPVRSVFEVAVEALKMNSLRSFFLSDRFDHISPHLDLFSDDPISSSMRF